VGVWRIGGHASRACDTRGMQLPLIGTVDLTPSGLFLVFAVLLAVGYLGWQIFEGRKKARAADADEASHIGTTAEGSEGSEGSEDGTEGDGLQEHGGSHTP
jgi:hypothetical protein